MSHLFAQVFKTYDGAAKRAAFENRHKKSGLRYCVVRFRDGVRDEGKLDTSVWQAGEYTWRIERR